MKDIILASASPRRKKLLKKAGIKFKVVESGVNENFAPGLNPQKVVEKLSLKKARAVSGKHHDSIIIAADTLLVLGDQILGKPKDAADVKRMLALFSNNTHSVVTGYTVLYKNMIITKSEITKISMKKISDSEIDRYARTKEPYDKAGAYATQGWAKKYITKIEGDEFNAIGLPIKSIIGGLKKLGAF